MTKTLETILPNVLTVAKAPPTKERPVCIKDWAAWLKMEASDPEVEALIRAVGRFGLHYKRGDNACWLALLGKCGVGKTHAATRMWNHVAARCSWQQAAFHHSAIYWPTFTQELRAGTGFEKLTDMMDWPVLFLDDIGAERDSTGFASEQLNALLGRRVGKWTILTSNLMLNQIAEIDPRIADRIIREPGNCYLETDTLSFGLRKHAQARMPHAD